MRHVGWIAVGMGLFGTLFMIAWMSMPIAEGVRMLTQREWFGFGLVGFGLLGLFGLVPALGILVTGLAVVANRTRCIVAVGDGKVSSTEQLLFFRWRRKCPTDRIQRLRITAAAGPGHAGDMAPWLGDISYALVGEREGARNFVIAPGYPRALLTQLAHELARRMEADIDTSTLDKSDSPQPVRSAENPCHGPFRLWTAKLRTTKLWTGN